MAKSFDPPNVWSPFGAFSQSVICGGGKTVYLKGQVALDTNGQIVGDGDMATQVVRGSQMTPSVSFTKWRMSRFTTIWAFCARG